MQFRTEIEEKQAAEPILLSHKILLMGSCFSQELGGFLENLKFRTCINPLGIVFNPISLVELLCRIINQREVKRDELVEHRGIYSHYDFHSIYNSTSANDYLECVNQDLSSAYLSLQNCDHLFITLGTAIVYKKVSNNAIVNNCHKMSKALFQKSFLDVSEIVAKLNELIMCLKSFNNDLCIHFTISPVRHTRDGLENNALSKSILRTAIANVISGNPEIQYFPSYEIIVDDLRDYRYYKDDLIHPNSMATAYIWEKFCERYIPTKVKHKLDILNKINTSIRHRALVPHSAQHQGFLKDLLEKIEHVEQAYHIDYSLEKESITARII